jgi:hypothetical protein
MADLSNTSVETLGVGEVLSKQPSQSFAEGLALGSFYPATPYHVGSDFGIYSEAMTPATVAEFIRSRAPLGYSPFRDFVAGEYKFRRAYVNFVFNPLDGADAQLSLVEASINADVPDKTETNVGEITSAATGLTVTFLQTFAAAPKVLVTPISGTTAVVPVLTGQPTTTGFTVKLFDLSGTAVTGSFIWTAIGY